MCIRDSLVGVEDGAALRHVDGLDGLDLGLRGRDGRGGRLRVARFPACLGMCFTGRCGRDCSCYCRRARRNGPNDANQCTRSRASRAPCRPHSSRVAALVVRRARRPCSACTLEVCVNRQGYCPCCGADAAAHQQQCDEQCSDHYLLQQLLGWRDLWPILVGADALGCVRAISATARTDCCQVRETSYGSHQKQ